ncbi:response regulator transcription factor [Inediibacterium massiliense]|uniref:response regulator transcription factor n=1 Tax=Inediibacterium massiliense TaxID=1658111 RepID=UPI0006B52A27|nr:response regulator transcription factor [Inediibacterium massiliense]
MKILLVEDEVKLSSILHKGLKKQGFVVDTAFDGEEALCHLEINCYDLIILDLNLPKVSGFKVLKTIRESDNLIKVLILSAKNNIEDKVLGLDLGANDYLEKPFDFLELSARIRNLLRWDFTTSDEVITYKDLTIDLGTKTVQQDGTYISLTNKEFGILEYLARNKDRYILPEEIIEHVWDSDADLFSNSYKYHISILKKKLKTKDVIVNIRGKGYKFGGRL